MIFYNMPLDDVTGADFENSPYTYFRPTASSVYKAPAKRSQHVSNIVRRNMLRAFSHPIATCCGMMGVVVSNLTIFKTKANNTQHVETHPNTVVKTARNMLRPTIFQNVALVCCNRLAGDQ